MKILGVLERAGVPRNSSAQGRPRREPASSFRHATPPRPANVGDTQAPGRCGFRSRPRLSGPAGGRKGGRRSLVPRRTGAPHRARGPRQPSENRNGRARHRPSGPHRPSASGCYRPPVPPARFRHLSPGSRFTDCPRQSVNRDRRHAPRRLPIDTQDTQDLTRRATPRRRRPASPGCGCAAPSGPRSARSRREDLRGVTRAAAPSPARQKCRSASRTAAVSSRSCASQARAASTASARNISHSTAQTAVVRELAEPVGEVALPLPAQPRDARRRDVAEEAFRNIEAPEHLIIAARSRSTVTPSAAAGRGSRAGAGSPGPS